jgi:hypothetical protein
MQLQLCTRHNLIASSSCGGPWGPGAIIRVTGRWKGCLMFGTTFQDFFFDSLGRVGKPVISSLKHHVPISSLSWRTFCLAARTDGGTDKKLIFFRGILEGEEKSSYCQGEHMLFLPTGTVNDGKEPRPCTKPHR